MDRMMPATLPEITLPHPMLEVQDILDLAAEAPDSEELAPTPFVNLWQAVMTPESDLCLFGRATGHPILGQAERRIITPQLFALSDDRRWCRMPNRFYRLGRLMKVRVQHAARHPVCDLGKGGRSRPSRPDLRRS
ncbi:MAG: DUF6634 family protein [Cypionkella sp.]